MENKTHTLKSEKIKEIRFLTILRKKLFLIILVGVVVASAVYAYSSVTATPTYTATIMLYVNNASISVGGTSISVSQGDISAARSLVNTLVVILNRSTVLDEVIERTGVPYTYNQLMGMVSAEAENNTEIMKVTVTTDNPETSALIADTIAEVFPIKISEIIDGSSARLLAHTRVTTNSSTQNVLGNSVKASVAAMALVYALFLFLDFENQSIESTEYLLETYDIPVLGEVPNLTNSVSKSYYQNKSGYGYSHKPLNTEAENGGKSNE